MLKGLDEYYRIRFSTIKARLSDTNKRKRDIETFRREIEIMEVTKRNNLIVNIGRIIVERGVSFKEAIEVIITSSI